MIENMNKNNNGYQWRKKNLRSVLLTTIFSTFLFAITLEGLQTKNIHVIENFSKVSNSGEPIDIGLELSKKLGTEEPVGEHEKGPGPATGGSSTGPSSSKVTIDVQKEHIVMDNGIVQLQLSNPDGLITGIRYNGIDNLLEVHDAEDSRGYWDVVWSEKGANGGLDKMKTTDFKIILQNDHQAEVSFTSKWETSLEGKLPLNIDKRYILLSGSSGFYTYASLEHMKGWPAFSIGEARIAFKLSEKRFQYMAVGDKRQRMMPTFDDRNKGQPLAYPEAVLLTNPANPSLKGEVDDKYQYSMDNKDNRVHGWMSTDPPAGMWMITATDEFRTGGPFKQDLSSHAGPTTLAMFISSHYTGEDLAPQFENGEPWKKVFGPVFIYLNTAPPSKDPHTTLWEDAKNQMKKEVQSWPYNFPASADFPTESKRGTVAGTLQVFDRYITKNKIPANTSYVGLALPGDAGSWQRECKGYQFWTTTDTKGSFSIKNIRPGVYNLFATVPGFIGDYKYNTTIEISPGSNVNVGTLVYEPPRDGPTLWEIGFPDRTGAEFYVPKPIPKYTNKLYQDQPDWFRQYGLWEEYSSLYPKGDLVYKVGASKDATDWFYAHVPRNLGNKLVPTTWQVVFNVDSVVKSGVYKLRVAFASATYAELQVRFNDVKAERPHFTTGRIGKDNSIARHGIHGLYWLFNIDVPGTLLLQGQNTLFLTQTRTASPYYGLIYDYLRLEAPAVNTS